MYYSFQKVPPFMVIPSSLLINLGTFAPPPRFFQPPWLLERYEYVRTFVACKGQLILECPFGVIKLTKKAKEFVTWFYSFDVNWDLDAYFWKLPAPNKPQK